MGQPVSKSIIRGTRALLVDAFSDPRVKGPVDAAYLRGFTNAFGARSVQCALTEMHRDGIVVRERRRQHFIYRLSRPAELLSEIRAEHRRHECGERQPSDIEDARDPEFGKMGPCMDGSCICERADRVLNGE